jgi:hypothetical protein
MPPCQPPSSRQVVGQRDHMSHRADRFFLREELTIVGHLPSSSDHATESMSSALVH